MVAQRQQRLQQGQLKRQMIQMFQHSHLHQSDVDEETLKPKTLREIERISVVLQFVCQVIFLLIKTCVNLAIILLFNSFFIFTIVGTQGATQMNRGCVQNGGSEEQTCRRAANVLPNVNLPFCQICSNNECNTGAASGVFSSIILIAASFLIVALKLF